jgi:hypothetical protein
MKKAAENNLSIAQFDLAVLYYLAQAPLLIRSSGMYGCL